MVEWQTYGFLKDYSAPAIPLSSKRWLGISQADIDKYKFFNVVLVSNNHASVIIKVMLDGIDTKAVRIYPKQTISINGSRFRKLMIENLDGATGLSAGDITVSIQKDFDNFELAKTYLRMKGEVVR